MAAAGPFMSPALERDAAFDEVGHSVFTFESFGVAEEFDLDSSKLVRDMDAVKARFKQAKDAST